MAIHIFVASSMDGFYLPLNLQRLHGFEIVDYENLYRNADLIITPSGGYAELEDKEFNKKKKVYKVTKDRRLLPYAVKGGPITIDEIKEGKKGNVLIIGNDNKLNNYLFEKNWVNEIVLCQFPIMLGKGRRSFPALAKSENWSVKGFQLFDNGITMIFYGNNN